MTLYAIRPDPVTGSFDDAEVVAQSKYGWGFLEQAVTLWHLLDDPRAGQVQEIMHRAARAAGDGEVRLYADDLREMVRLLTGIENAILAAGIVDSHWRVPPGRLEELARRVPAMDLTAERSVNSKTNALGEVMTNAISIRNFLSDAIRTGCVVAIG